MTDHFVFFHRPLFKGIFQTSLRAVFICLLLIFPFSFSSFGGIKPPVAKQGQMQLSNWKFDDEAVIFLDGEWEFYQDELISPIDFDKERKGTPAMVRVPYNWNRYKINGKPHARKGVGTFRLKVTGYLPVPFLTIETSHIRSSHKLWINGQLISENGVLARNDSISKPKWNPETTTFEVTSDTLEIVLHVSNYHYRKGGIEHSILLGTPEKIQKTWEERLSVNALSVGALGFMGLFFIVVFLFWNKEMSTLYFALLCLLWAIRSSFSNLFLFSVVVPDFSWQVIMRIEHISVYLSLIAGTNFFDATFPGYTKKYYLNALMAVNYLCTALTIILPSYLFSFLAAPYQIFLLLNLSYIFYIIIKAVTTEIKEAWFSVASVCFMILAFAYDLLIQRHVFAPNLLLLNLGYFSVFFLNSMILAYRFGIISKIKT